MSAVAALVAAAAMAGVTDPKVFAALIKGAEAAAEAPMAAAVEVAAAPAKPAGKIVKVAAKPAAPAKAAAKPAAAPVVVAVEAPAAVPDHTDAPAATTWADDDEEYMTATTARAAGGAGAGPAPSSYAAAAAAADDASSTASGAGASSATIVVVAPGPSAKDYRRKKDVYKAAIADYYKKAEFRTMDNLWYMTQVETADGWKSVFDIFVEDLKVRFNFHGGITLMRKLGLAGPTEHVDFRSDPNGQAFRAAALEWLSESVKEYNISRRLNSSIVHACSHPEKHQSGHKWTVWTGEAKKADGIEIDPKNGAIMFVKL